MDSASWLALGLGIINCLQAVALAFIAAKTNTIGKRVDGAMSTLLDAKTAPSE